MISMTNIPSMTHTKNMFFEILSLAIIVQSKAGDNTEKYGCIGFEGTGAKFQNNLIKHAKTAIVRVNIG